MQGDTAQVHSSSINVQQGYSHKKLTLSIDNNWRNTEIFSGWGLWDMLTPDGCKGVDHEVGSFTHSALNSDIWVTLTGLIAEWSQFQKTKNVHFRPDSHGTLHVRTESCLPPVLWPGFPGRLTSPFQSLLCGATVSETTQSGPHQEQNRDVGESNKKVISPQKSYLTVNKDSIGHLYSFIGPGSPCPSAFPLLMWLYCLQLKLSRREKTQRGWAPALWLRTGYYGKDLRKWSSM